MKSYEMERVYLAKELPKGLKNRKSIEIEVGDFFDSNDVDALRIRKKGSKYELIKKEGSILARRTEHTISIKKGEYNILIKATRQNHKKIRYLYPVKEGMCEIDFYKGRLNGYVRLEVEFKSIKAMKSFKAPSWFGTEITKINHVIHDDLGTVSFDDMKKRYAKRNIILKKLFLR